MFNLDSYYQALKFATMAHCNQKIPGSPLPYLFHVVQVCEEVRFSLAQAHKGLCINLAIQCALLHDVLEDTDIMEERKKASIPRRSENDHRKTTGGTLLY